MQKDRDSILNTRKLVPAVPSRIPAKDSNVVDAKVAAAASPSSTNPDARQGSSDGVSERIVWMRCRRRLPDNPAVHTSVLASLERERERERAFGDVNAGQVYR